ncbi:MAG: hypothetical protein NTY38_09800, partial [Acidobacteria bacterium]|nr:hypothetical protein [Acidobacteriota bacterium]
AATVVHGYYAADGRSVRGSSVVESMASHHIRPAVEESYRADDLVTAATAIARGAANGPLRPFPNVKAEALRYWSEAGMERDPRAMVALLRKSLEADPNFGLAYLGLLELQSAAGDDGEVRHLLDAARRAKLGEAERVEIEYLGALKQRDAKAGEKAAAAMLGQSSGDLEKLVEMAGLAYRERHFGPAAKLYAGAARLDSKNSNIWNQLAYSQAFAGDQAAAEQSLRKLAEVDPANPNGDDSAADIHFYFGSFAKAEASYLSANRKSPAFLGGGPLLKAAQSRLMTGDVAGADQLLARYVSYRRAGKDPRIGLLECQWLYLTGRKQQALAALGALFGQPQVAAAAEAQAAIWSVAAGSAAEAQQHARGAVKGSATDPSSRFVVALAAFLSQPAGTAAEWRARVERAFPGPQLANVRLTAEAYALLLGKQPREAIPVLRKLIATQDPAANGAETVLLAGALVDSGSPAEAAALLRTFPIPQNEGISLFAELYFPRLFALRAKALGDTAAARESLAVYQKLAR